jgi:hypothetical protein
MAGVGLMQNNAAVFGVLHPMMMQFQHQQRPQNIPQQLNAQNIFSPVAQRNVFQQPQPQPRQQQFQQFQQQLNAQNIFSPVAQWNAFQQFQFRQWLQQEFRQPQFQQLLQQRFQQFQQQHGLQNIPQQPIGQNAQNVFLYAAQRNAFQQLQFRQWLQQEFRQPQFQQWLQQRFQQQQQRPQNIPQQLNAQNIFSSVAQRNVFQQPQLPFQPQPQPQVQQPKPQPQPQVQQPKPQPKPQQLPDQPTLQQETEDQIQSINNLRLKIAKNNKIFFENQSSIVTTIQKFAHYAFENKDTLTRQEVNSMSKALVALVNEPILRLNNGLFAINECDSAEACLDFAIIVEAEIMQLDAIANKQVGLTLGKKLGSGAFNTVHESELPSGKKVATKNCDAQKMRSNRRKFINDGIDTSKVTGHIVGSYRHNMATVAIHDMMKELGLMSVDVVAGCSAGMVLDKRTFVPSLVMDMAGKTVGSIARDEYSKRRLLRSNRYIRTDTCLQIIDVICGQVDRHASNLSIDDKTGGVVAFDNDWSFPSSRSRPGLTKCIPDKLIDRGNEPWAAVPGRMFRTFCMPPVIDTNMFDAINNLDLKKLKSICEGCGLTPGEVDATVFRGKLLKEAATRLYVAEKVISPNDWVGSPVVKRLCSPKNFYAFAHTTLKLCL